MSDFAILYMCKCVIVDYMCFCEVIFIELESIVYVNALISLILTFKSLVIANLVKEDS